jgi:hypothetical protein
MEIQRHNTFFTREHIFWPFKVLNRINTNSTTSSLTFEVIVTITNSEEIFVSWIPADASNILSFGFFVVDSTYETNISFWFVDVTPSSVFEVISVIIKDIILFILNDSSFHNFQTSFEAGRIKRFRFLWFWGLFHFLTIVFFFSKFQSFSFFFSFKLLHIKIKDLPLVDVILDRFAWWWACGNTFVSWFVTQSLTLSFRVIKLVSDGLS